MKRSELEHILKQHGFSLVRSNKHVIWSNGTKSIPLPNHKEVNRMIARRTLKEINYSDWKKI